MKHASGILRIVPVVIAGTVLILGCLSPANGNAVVKVSQPDEAIRARELWEKVLLAKGGREQLREIKNLYVAADQGRGHRQLTFDVFPGYRFEFGYDSKRENTAIQVANAKKEVVWWQVQGKEARPRKYSAHEEYANLAPQFIYLLVTHDLDPVPLRLRKERMGLKRVDVIEIEAKGWRVDYYIDPETHLPLRVVLPLGVRSHAAGDMNHIVTLDDYALVDGIMMPHKATRTFTFNSQKLVDRLSFEINAEYDPQVFEQAPTPRTDGEAWRAKKL